jgi:hypothetical protein
MAREYGKLPSEILANATTFDIMIDDCYDSWDKYQRMPPGERTAMYKQDDLVDLMAKVKQSKE